jgi:glycosyltransferase involved in cell wall biosynthesis
MKLLFLTRYASNGASSRYRSFQYFPFLEQAGFECQVEPFFDEAYLIHRYQSGSAHVGDVFRAFLRRLAVLLTVRSYELVVIEYELIPYFPAILERWLFLLGVSYLVDYDDAIFHRYDAHRIKLVRFFLGQKIAGVIRKASVVTAGNNYLANYARRSGASRVEIIPTVIDLQRYPLLPAMSYAGMPIVIGWIGSPTTAKYLKDIAPVLAEVCAGGRGVVRLIGSGKVILPDVPVFVVPWDESTEVTELQKFDIGIMPLPDEPWERGKCGFKLIQYMACGLPIVGSPVGVNCEIIDQGVNGYLAATHTEWVMALNALLTDAELRQRMGSAGRKQVELVYSLQVTGPKLAELITTIADGS